MIAKGTLIFWSLVAFLVFGAVAFLAVASAVFAWACARWRGWRSRERDVVWPVTGPRPGKKF